MALVANGQQTTAFTYQGRLSVDGNPVSGKSDLVFKLFAASNGGAQVGPALTNSLFVSSNGLFTTSLDFGGGFFDGTALWLEIGVRTNPSALYTTLSPRQPITPAPYSLFAANAASANTLLGTVPGESLSGTYSSAVTMSNSANQFAGSFSGNGAGISNLNLAVTVTVGQSNAMFGPFTPGTTTAGLQEALNFLPQVATTNNLPRGGVIQIGPGIYTNLTLDLNNSYYTSVILQGAGEIATELSFNNTMRPGLRTINNYGNPEGARLHLYVRDCGLIAEQNTTNAIVDLTEVAVLDIERCYFSWYGYVKNSLWGISTAPNVISSNVAPNKVIGAHVWGTDENNTRFYKCHFGGLAVGIWASSAHLTVEDCEFVHVANYYDTVNRLTVFANGWPADQAPSLGSCVLMDGMGYEAQVIRGNFIQSRSAVALLHSIIGNYLIQGGYVEGGGLIYSDDSAPLAMDNFNGGDWGAYYVNNTSGNWAVTQFYSKKTYGGGIDMLQAGTLWGIADGSSVSVDPTRYMLRLDDQKNVRVKNNLTVGGIISGNASGMANLPAGNLAGRISNANLPAAMGITTNLSVGSATLYITNGLIMRVSTP